MSHLHLHFFFIDRVARKAQRSSALDNLFLGIRVQIILVIGFLGVFSPSHRRTAWTDVKTYLITVLSICLTGNGKNTFFARNFYVQNLSKKREKKFYSSLFFTFFGCIRRLLKSFTDC